MSEDKMREEFESRLCSFVANDKNWIMYGFEEGMKACAEYYEKKLAERDAEIASRDLMIKELREALLHIVSNCTPEGIGQNNLWIAAQTSLANSEHHDFRALEIKLLEARIDELERLNTLMPSGVRMAINALRAKLAELN